MYTWDNVYGYDKEFRMHLAKHPNRSWAVILQQAWSIKLRDRLGQREIGASHYGGAPSSSNFQGDARKGNRTSGTGEPCRRYNKGKCTFGARCKYDHRCAYEPCGKFGHFILNCRKLQADRERTNTRKDVTMVAVQPKHA